MRSSNQNTNFVAEFAAKRAAQLERARQLREERKKAVPTGNDERPPSGSPMTYARSNRDDEGSRPTSATNEQYYAEECDTSCHQQQHHQMPLSVNRAPPGGPRAVSSSVPDEITVTEDDFRRAVKHGVITPDQARQLWSVLSDPNTGNRLDSFKRAQPSAVGYDPRRYDAGGDSYTGPPVGLETKKPPVRTRGKPEWNSDAGFEPAYVDVPPTSSKVMVQSLAPASSKKVLGASYAVRQPPAWNDDADISHADPPPPVTRAPAKKPMSKVPQRQLPEWNDDCSDAIPQAAPLPKQRAPIASKQPARQAQQDAPRAALGSRQTPKQPLYASPPPASRDDDDEVEEFQRMKDEQARQFEEALQDADDGARLVPCSLCGRTFRETIISRHQQACAKASKKRKTYDMTKARLEGIDGAEELLRQQKRSAKNAPAPVEKPAGKIPKWKLQHQQFQAVLKMNKGGPAGLTGPPIPMPEELDDRVPCPHCGRKFATETAARHIPKCMTTINKPKSLARPIRR